MSSNHSFPGDDLNLTALALGQCGEAERAAMEQKLAGADRKVGAVLEHTRRLADELRLALAADNPAPSESLRDTLRHRLRERRIEQPSRPIATALSPKLMVRWGIAGLIAASLGGLLLSVWSRNLRYAEQSIAQNSTQNWSSRREEHWDESVSAEHLSEERLSEGRSAAPGNDGLTIEGTAKSQAPGTQFGWSVNDFDNQGTPVDETVPKEARKAAPSGNGTQLAYLPATAAGGAPGGAAVGRDPDPESTFGARTRHRAYDTAQQGQAAKGLSGEGEARFLGAPRPAGGNAHHYFFSDSYGAALSQDQAAAGSGAAGPARSMPGGMGMGLGGEAAGMMAGAVGGSGGDLFSVLPGASAEQYAPIVENDFIAVQGQAALSTFSIDVDTASYANIRRFLTQGQLPPPNAVRIEELVNYFRYDYPQPQAGEPFSVNMEMGECPWQPQHLLLRVGLQGREIPHKERPVSNLVFLLDVSGSMADGNKLPLLKQVLSMLVRELREDDRVSIVTYAGEAGLRLPPTTGDQQAKILSAIDSLLAGGSTNGSAGIDLAYEQAQAYFRPEGTNRVILATDGDLNVGITDDESLVQLIKEKAAGGTFLTVLGFGEGNLQDAKMERLADNGNGVYAYIDGLREGRKVLIEQMSGSLVTIAKDVKVQIEFNPREVQSYRLLGYENRMLTAEEFNDDRRDAGEIGAGHSVTALYELKPFAPLIAARQPAEEAEPLKYQLSSAPRTEPLAFWLSEAAASGEILTLKLRYKEPDGQQSKLSEYSLKDRGGKFSAASKDFQFASAVASFGMVLRNSQHRGDGNLAAAAEIAASALGEDQGGYRAEFVDLVRKAQALGVK